MNVFAAFSTQPNLRRTLVAAAIAGAGACAVAAPLPTFTLNPGAVGLAGSTFTADNLLVSDYSTVTLSGTSFTDIGYLSISNVQLGGSTIVPGGLNSAYGLYIAFTGTGTTTSGDPATTFTFGNFATLDYTL
jgi:hypothetical protein